MAEHFVAPPDWLWYILFYFFLAGLSGGSYTIATLLRLRGAPEDAPLSRLGYYAAWPPLLICPILLILDLGTPLRFWHMIWNLTPGDAGLNFKYWSPMSLGVWALIVYSGIATVSFAETLARDGKLRMGLTDWLVRVMDGLLGKVFAVVGMVFALFIAGYTGVLLAVSNQPVWSDTWALGGLFLASGLSGSAALLMFLTRYRPEARASFGMLAVSERLYALLEGALIVVFVLTLLWAGTQGLVFGFPWLLLWIVVLAGLLPGLRGLVVHRLSPTGEAVVAPVAVPLLVLAGVLALRGAIIFSIQV
ncbi:MAG: polysulfide reductase [Streptosporangiales bacterium]|nr:polysulfide reductase [Streptosporangiales bacterium]